MTYFPLKVSGRGVDAEETCPDGVTARSVSVVVGCGPGESGLVVRSSCREDPINNGRI